MTQIYDPTRHGNRRHLRVPLAVVAAAVVIGAVIVTVFLTTGSHHAKPSTPGTVFTTASPLAETSTTCDTGTLADNDHTLVIDMAGDEAGSGTATIDDVLCILDELDVPQAIITRMESTRALDGMQSAPGPHTKPRGPTTQTTAWT